jgi:uncharacterized membrane protein YphA (DoxX/SURF4 family)
MNIKTITYWLSTALVAFSIGSGAIGELTHSWGTLETVTILGYPLYFLTIIGIWKLLGAAAILAPGLPRIKEWAYAGIVFNMTGAAASHAFSNDFGPGGYHIIATLSVAALAVVSWALRPSSRSAWAMPARPSRQLRPAAPSAILSA